MLTRAHFVESLPAGASASDYTWLRQRREDHLTIHDYLWRWDTDWFWCSKNLGAHLAPVRFLLGRKRLSSVTYQKIMRASHRWPLKALASLRPRSEPVIQDVNIPIANAAALLAEFEAEIGIRPVRICPFVVPDGRFSLFHLRTNTPYINFGFWDRVPVQRAGRLLQRSRRGAGGPARRQEKPVLAQYLRRGDLLVGV